MKDVGVRELKTRASEIVSNVRRKRARYVVTYRGKPVALISPLELQPAPTATPLQADEAIWAELKQLGQQLSKHWSADQTATELLSAMRR